MLNENGTLRVVRAKDPEALTQIIRSVKAPMQIMGFGSDDSGHFAYYRTTSGMEKRVLGDIARNSLGGEANQAGDRDV